MTDGPIPTTRFAPSPNGSLHLGHAYSAIVAHDLARAKPKGRFVLRIEDIDGPRSRPELADEFRRDLEWLGLEWEEVPAQSMRLATYERAAADLLDDGWLYPCACTRAEIAALPLRTGDDGVEYPGSCRHGGRGACSPAHGKPVALRLDVDRVMAELPETVWVDTFAGSVIADPRMFGDVVIVRKDLPASYHLAATLDDTADAITLVTRGRDLFEATHVHRVLQELLRLPVLAWHHHDLMLDETGAKLAKRARIPSAGDAARSGGGRFDACRAIAVARFEGWNTGLATPIFRHMNWFLILVLAVLCIMVVVSLVRGIIAFLQTTKIDLESGEGETMTEMQAKQNKAMFARIKYQAMAIAVVAIIALVAS